MSAENKSTFASTAAKAAAIAAGAVAAAAVIPQDELVKTGLPRLWESIKGIAAAGVEILEENAKKFRPTAFAWWSKLKGALVWWTLISLALVLSGIEVKTRFGSSFGHVLVAAGTVSFAGLGILLFILSDGIAAVLYFQGRMIGGGVRKAASLVGLELPTVLDRVDFMKYREKIRLILAGATILCFSLLFTMFFPAWSTLGWVMCFWAMVGVALCAALYLDMKMGKAVRAVFYVTIGLIVAMFVVFILDRLTGGALGFDGFQKWLRAINGSELLAAFLVLVPATLLLMGVFAKEKERKASFVWAAKYVGIGCALLGAFLLYKGTISWKQLSGKEPPKVLTKTVDKAEGAYLDALDGGSKSGTKSAPRGTASNGAVYASPPAGLGADPSPAPAARTSKPRAKKPPLPPLKAKEYDDEAAAYTDLDSI
ncbi:MAG TPA: hypothetical protein VJ694_00495 [Patescibacteria group bacterium]|nr:hypothetical protein [Patescibacteria group bacterium]